VPTKKQDLAFFYCVLSLMLHKLVLVRLAMREIEGCRKFYRLV